MESIIANAQALVDEAVEFGESSKFGSAIALNPKENEENSGRIVRRSATSISNGFLPRFKQLWLPNWKEIRRRS
ncbi:MAG: hypothetical protein IPP17_31285 [Bacteroidetes bacterium]|nr:hypothetical protein [Bacteroidota bacterium]